MWKPKKYNTMKLEIKAGQYDLLMETSAPSLQKMSNPLDRWVYTIVSFFTDGETKSLSDLTSTVQQDMVLLLPSH